jgi:transposase
MKTATKFIKILTKAEQHKLIRDHQMGETFRIRNRSHAILLSREGFAVAEIAKICRVDRDTVSVWLDNWNELGSKGLADDERSGRPAILTLEEQEKAVEIALKNPKFPHRQLAQIKRETGKAISKYTLKNMIKKKTISGKESN